MESGIFLIFSNPSSSFYKIWLTILPSSTGPGSSIFSQFEHVYPETNNIHISHLAWPLTRPGVLGDDSFNDCSGNIAAQLPCRDHETTEKREISLSSVDWGYI